MTETVECPNQDFSGFHTGLSDHGILKRYCFSFLVFSPCLLSCSMISKSAGKGKAQGYDRNTRRLFKIHTPLPHQISNSQANPKGQKVIVRTRQAFCLAPTQLARDPVRFGCSAGHFHWFFMFLCKEKHHNISSLSACGKALALVYLLFALNCIETRRGWYARPESRLEVKHWPCRATLKWIDLWTKRQSAILQNKAWLRELAPCVELYKNCITIFFDGGSAS